MGRGSKPAVSVLRSLRTEALLQTACRLTLASRATTLNVAISSGVRARSAERRQSTDRQRRSYTRAAAARRARGRDTPAHGIPNLALCANCGSQQSLQLPRSKPGEVAGVASSSCQSSRPTGGLTRRLVKGRYGSKGSWSCARPPRHPARLAFIEGSRRRGSHAGMGRARGAPEVRPGVSPSTRSWPSCTGVAATSSVWPFESERSNRGDDHSCVAALVCQRGEAPELVQRIDASFPAVGAPAN